MEDITLQSYEGFKVLIKDAEGESLVYINERGVVGVKVCDKTEIIEGIDNLIINLKKGIDTE